MKKAGIAVAVLCSIPLWGQQSNAPDLAAQNAALEQKVRDLEDRLIALEGKVRILQSAQAPPAQAPTEAQPAAPAAAARKASNPAPEPRSSTVSPG